MAKTKLPESVRKQFAAWGRQGGLKGRYSDKVKAGKAGSQTRLIKRQKRVDDAWDAYKRSRNGEAYYTKREYIKKKFPRIKTDDLKMT